ncbi:glycerol-3-phosphate 1-O-acyltransferase PlsY [Brevibacillus daliensis]|uniref:glycerol-3-phosphate 1-O-acyltransferase PlsY n=1 Tax=Brevibacillus daliensis TaxID=2892995 RepID=UPI001E341499|nr:glycerol-3-phosphate 1-O-acyltransferase PlsY [Brevibacillus daliensis]
MILLSLIISYLIGSISFSYLIGKKVAGIDIRSHGSGNAGATNTLRVLGKGPAVMVLLLDALKPVATMYITYWLTDSNQLAFAAAGLFTVIGHNWPIYYGFRGGKGIATTAGVALALNPLAFVICAVLAIASIAITKYVSLGSLLFVTLFPILLLLFTQNYLLFFISLLITVLAYYRHYSNITNLMQGKERKIGDKSHRKLN